ncbi:MAG: hypothetical protein J5J00_00080 [Deltaproteobacteria bacterium]|nr:hypothetical protein [Deltaproteobacteria bacterium]
MQVYKVISAVFVAAISVHYIGFAHAQPGQKRPEISGQIVLEETGGKKVNAAQLSHDIALEYITTLAATVEKLKSGAAAPLDEIDNSAMAYLNSAYLYCSIQEGTCPYLLDALLEADVILSKSTGKIQCPTLSKFWKSYIASDLESRHRFLTPVTFMSVTAEFSEKQRPKYLKCKETVAEELAVTPNDFFVNRYGRAGKDNNVAKTLRFLKGLKEQGIDVYSKTTVQSR